MPQPTLEMLYRGKRGKSRAGIGHYAALDLKPHFAPLTVPFASEGCPPARGEQQQRKLKAELQANGGENESKNASLYSEEFHELYKRTHGTPVEHANIAIANVVIATGSSTAPGDAPPVR